MRVATTDGSRTAPRLLPFLNLGNLVDLPSWSQAPAQQDPDALHRALRTAGFVGINGDATPASRAAGMLHAAGGRVNRPGEVAALAARWRADGYACAILHVGWGHEDDAAVDAIVRDILAVSAGEGFPLFIETHRATITQDTWRTVRLVERHPDVRFNADFSHWYTGLEMVYGDWQDKLAFLAPVFERVRFFHGRIGNSGCIQMPLSHPSMPKAIGHFRELWTRSCAGFLRSAQPGEWIGFAPELLFPSINYAPTWRDAQGGYDEASDRWIEALELVRIAGECFAAAGSQARA
ncbi:MAG: hypothetical protein H0W72_14725 [Planctomycetes bacterium]|nr:hypothetical protein [Planctomycetota bacterium]